MKNKKTIITVTSIVAVLLVIVGVTYAYWLVTKTQTNQNIISSGCLDISLNGEKNDIELTNQFPMSDEDGMKLVPYEFTVTNNCSTSVDYQVNLESIGDSTNAIKASAIKVALDGNIKLLSAGNDIEPTISGAYESHSIAFGKLAASSNDNEEDTVTYKLRIWIDENAPISEQNKTFQSKISVTIGQGIENVFQQGTLAYDILSNYGSSNTVTEIAKDDIRHRSIKYSSANVYFYSTTNYWFGTEYTFDNTTNKYTLSGNLVQATLTECRNGTKACGKYTLNNSYSSSSSSSELYEITDFNPITEGVDDSSKNNYVNGINIIKYTNSFGVNSDNESGLYKMQDDLGDSYYFRGNVTNNYVKFGVWNENKSETFMCYSNWGYCDTSYSYETKQACENDRTNSTTYCEEKMFATQNEPMYWRIVRINGDGTIRLIYDGTKPLKNGEEHVVEIAHVAFNGPSAPAEMVEYTRNTSETDTTQVDSLIKETLDKWYETNLKTTYGAYIADSIFCNDREKISDDGYYITYAALGRFPNNPKLTCANKSDRYTVTDTTNGNGLLSYPIGLLTADEAIMINSEKYNSEQKNYIYVNKEFWTMTPSDYSDFASVYLVDKTNVSSRRVGNEEVYARPVINLKADVTFIGNGTINSPYEIVIE